MTPFKHALVIDDGLMFEVAKPGGLSPDREFVLAEFISARPCGIRDLFDDRESI
jgi:hypothetical protein